MTGANHGEGAGLHGHHDASVGGEQFEDTRQAVADNDLTCVAEGAGVEGRRRARSREGLMNQDKDDERRHAA